MENKSPIYDKDYVTLEYLRNYINKNDEEEKKVFNRNFGSQPTPPYYVNDTWSSDGGLYVCIAERLIGDFNQSDWKSIVNTEKYDGYIAQSIDITINMLNENQDHKIETFIQETDPSSEWETNVAKEKHLYDYWRVNNGATAKMFVRYATDPVTYGWETQPSPSDIWDFVDKHKTLYGVKPTSYDKGDLWYITSDIATTDIPTGCGANGWVIATKSATSFDKADWTLLGKEIDMDTLQGYFYTKVQINSSFSVLKDDFSAEISSGLSSLTATIQSTYATKSSMTEALSLVSSAYSSINTLSSLIDVLSTTVTSLSSTITQQILSPDGITGVVSALSTRLLDIASDNTKILSSFSSLNQTIATQTSSAFEQYFKNTKVTETMSSMNGEISRSKEVLMDLQAYIRYGLETEQYTETYDTVYKSDKTYYKKVGDTYSSLTAGTDYIIGAPSNQNVYEENDDYGSSFIELGKENAKTKLKILGTRLLFLTDGKRTAYISNNKLYIRENTVLKSIQLGDDANLWLQQVDDNGNYNIGWGGD